VKICFVLVGSIKGTLLQCLSRILHTATGWMIGVSIPVGVPNFSHLSVRNGSAAHPARLFSWG